MGTVVFCLGLSIPFHVLQAKDGSCASARNTEVEMQLWTCLGQAKMVAAFWILGCLLFVYPHVERCIFVVSW